MEKNDFENFVFFSKYFFEKNILSKIEKFSTKFFSMLKTFWLIFFRFSKGYFFEMKTIFLKNFKNIFLHDEKLFFVRIFLNHKSMIASFQRNQPELLGPPQQSLGVLWVPVTPRFFHLIHPNKEPYCSIDLVISDFPDEKV